jgi:hypothetical protein
LVFLFRNINSANTVNILILPFAYPLSGRVLVVELLLAAKLFDLKCLFGSFFMHPQILPSDSRV